MLTREQIALAFPTPVPDDRTAIPLLSPAEIDANRAATLAHVGAGDDIWLFVYGSLMWKPEPGFDERIPATLQGWHRSFCIWQWRYRGTRETPGLMMALDEGGTCHGAVLRAPGPDAAARLASVWTREMIGKAYRPECVEVSTERGTKRTITFVVDRNSHRYAGAIPEAHAAKHIAKPAGTSARMRSICSRPICTAKTVASTIRCSTGCNASSRPSCPSRRERRNSTARLTFASCRLRPHTRGSYSNSCSE